LVCRAPKFAALQSSPRSKVRRAPKFAALSKVRRALQSSQ
jgi:hypothetical protein